MTRLVYKTWERLIPVDFESEEEHLMYLRHLFGYEFAKDKIPKNSFVLEVGCGEGYGTNLLAKKVGKIIGLDVDKKTIDHATKKYGSENCIFSLYDGKIIPYKGSIFDAVVSFQVIEHVRDDANYVSEIFRVLKPEGIFLVTTPNATYRIQQGQKPWNRYHIREYYPDELETVLKNMFSDITIWGICSTDEVHKMEIERARRFLKVKARIISLIGTITPECTKPFIWKAMKSIIHRNRIAEKSADFLNKYSLNDFYITKDCPSKSLDLLGICKK